MARTLVPVGILLGALLLVSLQVGIDEILAPVSSVAPAAFVAMLCLSCFGYLGRALRWFLLFRCVDRSSAGSRTAAAPRQFVLYLAGYAFTLTPGRSGEAIRVWMAYQSFGLPVHSGASLIVADRFYDAIALTLIALICAGVLGASPAAAGVLAAILLAAMVALRFLPTAFGMWDWVKGAVPRFSHVVEKFRMFIAQLSGVVQPRRLPVFTVTSLIAWLLHASIAVVAFREMGVNLSPWHAVFVFALASLAGGASFLPGGLGGFEATMIALLFALDVAVATGFAVTLVVRLATLWFGVLLGILMLLVWTYLSSLASRR